MRALSLGLVGLFAAFCACTKGVQTSATKGNKHRSPVETSAAQWAGEHPETSVAYTLVPVGVPHGEMDGVHAWNVDADPQSELLIQELHRLRWIDDVASEPHELWRYDSARPIVNVRIADFNRDGRVDIALTPYTSVSEPSAERIAAEIFLSKGGRWPQSPTITLRGYGGGALAVGDLNGDGWLDITVGELNTNSSTPNLRHQYVYLNQAGTFNDEDRWTRIIDTPVGDMTAHVVADIDEDGRLDWIVGGTAPAWGYVIKAESDGRTWRLPESFQALPPVRGADAATLIHARAAYRKQESVRGKKRTGIEILLGFNIERVRGAPIPGYSLLGGTALRYASTKEKSSLVSLSAISLAQSDWPSVVMGRAYAPEKEPSAPLAPEQVLAFAGGHRTLASQGVPVVTKAFVAQDVTAALIGVDPIDEPSRLIDHRIEAVAEQDGPLLLVLPEPTVVEIEAVEVDRRSTSQFSADPPNGWVVVAQVSKGQRVAVRYKSIVKPDLIVADLQHSLTLATLRPQERAQY